MYVCLSNIKKFRQEVVILKTWSRARNVLIPSIFHTHRVFSESKWIRMIEKRFCWNTWVPQSGSAKEGTIWESSRYMGVRCYPVHSSCWLPAVLGRGPASTLRADQGRIIWCTYHIIIIFFKFLEHLIWKLDKKCYVKK